MAISLRSLALAIGSAIVAKEREKQARWELARRKDEEQAEREAAWQAELARRHEAELDLDGSRAAARAERERELKSSALPR